MQLETPKNKELSPRVLWVDEDRATLDAATLLFENENCNFIAVQNPADALQVLKEKEISVLIVDQNLQGFTGLEILSHAKAVSPNTTRIMVSDKFSEALILDSINQAAVFSFVTKPWKDVELRDDIAKAIEQYARTVGSKKLYKEVTRQNRELEALTQNLEKLVAERTFHIEISADEQREKLARVRALIRFIKELTRLSTIEEVMQEFRKELRKFHKLSDPILIYRTSPEAISSVTFRSGLVHTAVSAVPFEFPKRDSLNEMSSSKTMADLFSRPFGKVILLPLDSHVNVHSSQNSVGDQFQAMLCLEHSLSDLELGGLLDFISERIQSLSLAIDRILLEYQMTNVSYRWEKTFDGIQNPIAIIDVDYRLLRSNRHFAQKWARKKCFESLAEKNSPCDGCPVPEALKKGEPTSGQISVGSRVYEVYSYPIRLQGEQVSTNVVNHYVDITQARELTSRMIQNEKMGAIGLLAGNIAHELNNPLTGIRSLTQAIMAEVVQDSQLYGDLEEVEKAAQRSQVIIKNLLEFSTGKEGKRQKVELDELVEKTIPMLKTAMRSHRSEVNLDAKGIKVDVEPHLVQQVIFNLVNNACQAMKQAGTIRLITTRLDDNWIELCVEDTGEGIPEEIQGRIFEPFFTTKKEGSGTGLGLSMAKTMIERFGGSIGLSSKVNEGTRFWIRLPIVGK